MADGTQEWTEFTLPASPLTGPDTITEPTEEYSAPDLAVSVSTLTLTATLNAPVNVLKYDNPSSLAGTLTLNNPAAGVFTLVLPSTLALTGTVNAPNPRIRRTMGPVAISGTVNAPVPTVSPGVITLTLTGSVEATGMAIYSLPATIAGSLTLSSPLIIVTAHPATVSVLATLESAIPTPTATPVEITGTLTLDDPIPNAITTAATLNLSLTINAPTPVTSHAVGVGIGGALPLTISAGFSPTVGSIQPTIVRYIKDPIVTGGCPQCGTFLYKEGAKEIRSEAVYHGRNFEIRGDDDFVRCGRCGFILEPDKHPSHRRGSKTGWGMRYTEVEAGESDISYP